MGNAKRRSRSVKQLVLFVSALLLVAALVYYRQSAHLIPIIFARVDGTETDRLLVELASRPEEREKGLMYRKELAKDRGMLFIFPTETPHNFWMRNTYISLDMFFIDSNGVVVGILENVPVLNDERREVDKASLYVLEMVAGSAQRLGIGIGAKLRAGKTLPRGS